MDIQEKIRQNTKNIWQAMDDYRAHTYTTSVLDDITQKFVDRLAEDNAHAKAELRNLFRKSPVWNEELDALVINGTRTHDPDSYRVHRLASDILYPAYCFAPSEKRDQIDHAIQFFTRPDTYPTASIAALESLAPGAYVPGKKPSRVFKSLADALGVSDDMAGSDFQRLYAQFADELSARKIDFKLFVSLNPAHFLTMSNPKNDDRGDMMTSCHSLNVTDYEYNCGCSGYARDAYTFIAFVAADPDHPETLNNRKTSRQIFAYKPGNGLLLQSRLYNTSGGTCGAQRDSQLYRDLVQREISDLEDAANLWKTYPYVGNKFCAIYAGKGFGGYADWTYENFDAKLSIRNDHAEDFGPFTVGTYGLCIRCGCEIAERLYCACCKEYADDDDEVMCDGCGEYVHDTYPVINSAGNRIYVCGDCRDRYYDYCCECHEYHPISSVKVCGNGQRVCAACREEKYAVCKDCGKLFRKETLGQVLCPCCREKELKVA